MNIKQPWLRVLLFIPVFLIGAVIAGLIALGIATVYYKMNGLFLPDIGTLAEKTWFLTLSQVCNLIVSLIIIWWFRTKMDQKSVWSLGFQWKGFEKDAWIGFWLGTVLISLGFLLLWVSNNLVITNVQLLIGTFLLQIFLFMVVSIHEEVVVRGYILTNLMEATGKYPALLISAVLFGLMHMGNSNVYWVGVLNIILAGVLLGQYYIYKKNLWFPIMLHFSWNFFQGAVWGFEVSGVNIESIVEQETVGSKLLTGGEFGFEGSIISLILLVVAIIWIELKYGDLLVKS